MAVPFEVLLDIRTGEPTMVCSASGTLLPEGATEFDSNIHRYYITDENATIDDYIGTKYVKLNDLTTWHTRELCPDAEVYDWDTSSYTWVVNSTKLWQRARGERALYLNGSDWTQLPDSPLTSEKKAEWATYRQALRDLPSTQSSAATWADITWPTAPS